LGLLGQLMWVYESPEVARTVALTESAGIRAKTWDKIMGFV
jgi:hypothetical protein